jgi:hypothetical protein
LWNTNNGLNEIIKTPELSITQKEAVIKLWNREYPRSVMHETVNGKLYK